MQPVGLPVPFPQKGAGFGSCCTSFMFYGILWLRFQQEKGIILISLQKEKRFSAVFIFLLITKFC
ncbi:hypothetical protein DPQ25_00260 [Hydrogeniiclostridium mannosilyticum]|uniref:Uncharacterized protein n=1 Tax=Hydrogeniiclostridium mannosilyticum TaxID=2764322 RepID=A0A328UGV6_9FIRM|nr:hypothetical protein DPQ25_00260 [Hydrogeniiclostridium mannosilyticum]